MTFNLMFGYVIIIFQRTRWNVLILKLVCYISFLLFFIIIPFQWSWIIFFLFIHTFSYEKKRKNISLLLFIVRSTYAFGCDNIPRLRQCRCDLTEWLHWRWSQEAACRTESNRTETETKPWGEREQDVWEAT